MKIIITSGHFDPLHIGHVEYLELAKSLGDMHIVILNNDINCMIKKGRIFMPEDDRLKIVRALKSVDIVVKQIDTDTTVRKTLESIAQVLKDEELIFAKGGDRFSYEIPEREICEQYNIKLVDGLGKKIRSSTELIQNNERKTTDV